ncbi:hypothetical protein N7519_002643, partial [Penicillium mononematosum]|uniref:uncharacterized protein n=1 Tax=Penicillium mononematosum TaxID=268346 RepID=UPI00254773BA
ISSTHNTPSFFTGTIAKHVSTRVSFLQILELCTLHTSSRHFHTDIHCPNGSSFLENVQSQDMVLHSIYPRRLVYVDSLALQFYSSIPRRPYTDPHYNQVQIIGYIGRCIAHNNTTAMGPYIVSNVFILLGPTLFAASIYMTLGRLIRRVHGEHLSPIRVSRLTKTFVWFDVLSFAVQGNSSSLSVTGHAMLGKVCVIVGLAIQLISFSLFWCLKPSIPWQRLLHMLYAVSALILVRSIFRIVEYVMDNDGYPLMHEWTLYVFDSLPMAVVMVIFFIWYPDQVSPSADSERSIPLAHSYSEV